MVSKFHFGRRSPNTGRRSFQAEAAVEELKSVSGMSTPQGQAQFALCVDRFWQFSGGAMEDVAFMIKELGNQGEWHKALARTKGKYTDCGKILLEGVEIGRQH